MQSCFAHVSYVLPVASRQNWSVAACAALNTWLDCTDIVHPALHAFGTSPSCGNQVTGRHTGMQIAQLRYLSSLCVGAGEL